MTLHDLVGQPRRPLLDREIAELLGISDTRVQQLATRALQKLRQSEELLSLVERLPQRNRRYKWLLVRRKT
jgi:predicted XRE-type DNA-binding protein